MTVVDARSGEVVPIGVIVVYDDDRSRAWQLLAVEHANPFGSAVIRIRRLSDDTVHSVHCPVRWFFLGRLVPVIVAPT
jgi:hypothetical protein